MPTPHELELDAVLRLDEAWNAAYHRRAPDALGDLLADDWLGFFPDGSIVSKAEFLTGMAANPPAALLFERHASRLYGETAITRGTLFIGGERVQGFLRVYAKRGGEWRAVSVQVVP